LCARIVLLVVVSGAAGSAGLTQARWVVTDLGTLGGKESVAVASNDRGQVIGWSETGRKAKDGWWETRAFLWQGGKILDLGFEGARFGGPMAINNREQILLGESLWANGKLAKLGILGFALNDNGQVAGGDAEHAFLWQKGKRTDLDALPGGQESSAAAINDHGQITGSRATKDGW
jgi:probable HAF family extracellular repeat protein